MIFTMITPGIPKASANELEFDHFISEATQLAADDPTDNFIGSIELTIGNSYMLVDDSLEEIDPGRGTSPVIVDSRTLLPFRAIAEAIGGEVSWDESKQKVTIRVENQIIELQIGSSTMLVNGEIVYLDVAPVIINERTMVPARAIAESLGCEVYWEAETEKAYLARPFQTKRLIVQTTDVMDLSRFGAEEIVRGPENLAVLQFATIQETQEVYSQLEGSSNVNFVIPDIYIPETADTDIALYSETPALPTVVPYSMTIFSTTTSTQSGGETKFVYNGTKATSYLYISHKDLIDAASAGLQAILPAGIPGVVLAVVIVIGTSLLKHHSNGNGIIIPIRAYPILGPVVCLFSTRAQPSSSGSSPNITTTTLLDGTVGTSYSQTLTATGTVPITWSVVSGNLPNGLNLNSSSGAILGTPTNEGTSYFTVRAVDARGQHERQLSITVGKQVDSAKITTTTLPDGTVGTSYNQTLTATGTTPITWSVVSGNLPNGLNLNSTTGAITGTPTTSGTSYFTVRVENAAGRDERQLSVTIPNAPNLSITTTTLPGGTRGAPYNQILAATGSALITWSVVSGSLPGGLNLNSGTGAITGTPTAAGTFSFTVRAENTASRDEKLLSITIDHVEGVHITTTILPVGMVDSFYNQTLATTGIAPITWNIVSGSLPGGLNLNSNTGAITGMPTAAGPFSFTVQAESAGSFDERLLSITIDPMCIPPSIITQMLADSTMGLSYNQTLAATGTALFTWNVVSGGLPNG